jgi:hypothetical protein
MVGIVGDQEAWLTEVKISVQNVHQKITIPAACIDSPHVGVLLGQEGFFEQHRIKCEKDHDTFELMPVSGKPQLSRPDDISHRMLSVENVTIAKH